MNWRGFYTLFVKEVLRFAKVTVQTVLTPVITVLLYLLVFASVLAEHVEMLPGHPYSAFLVPGLIMMAILQNAFANSSSSLFQSKQTGNLVFILLAPISHLEFFLAYIGASVLRGLLVGAGVWGAALFFVSLPIYNLFFIFAHAFLGSAILGALGLISAITADKWDHVAAFQNFVILPMTFLSGVFFSIHTLPPFWIEVSLYNPFFYMIDGFRYGFLGVSDASGTVGLLIVSIFFILVSSICLWLLHSGYRMRA
jgi:ABC-2 type transport system permease protein